MRAPIPVLALAACLAACGEPVSEAPVGAPAPSVLRPAVRPAASAAPLPQVRRVGLVDPPSAPQDWRVACDRPTRVVTDASGARVLEVAGGDELRFQVPVPAGTPGFDQVVLEVPFQMARDLQVTLDWASGRQESTWRALEADGEPATLVFDFPGVDPEAPAPSSIVFAASRLPAALSVAHVELLARPLPAWYPEAGEPPRSVVVAGDVRPAVGLSAGRPVELDVPGGGELRFALGVPDDLRGGPAVVRVHLGGREHVLPLGEDAQEGRAWQEHRLPLGPGDAGTARFELEPQSEGREAACALSQPLVTTAGERPPTVLLFVSDTHRGDHLGAAQSGVAVSTPTLDALAARGTLFTDCTTSANVTTPSHVALLTGTHPRDTGVVDFVSPLAEDAPTLAERFSGAGFLCLAAVSVAHLGPAESGLGQGFDVVLRPGWRPRGMEDTVAALAPHLDAAEGLPLFVWLHVFDAHEPYEPPQPWDRLNYPEDRDPFDPSRPRLDHLRGVLPQELKELRDVDYVRALYRGEVSWVDHRLGLLLERGRLRDGWIAFTSDHGESLGEWGVWWAHAGLNPVVLHVPLVLAGPGVPSGRRDDRPVRQIDVGRTLLDLAGLEAAPFPGQNLLAEEGARPERFALSVDARSASITRGPWHLVLILVDHPSERLRGPRTKHRHAFELYRRDDPSEPVADPDPAVVADLRRRLTTWLAAARDEGWATAGQGDPQLLAELAALGYADPRESTDDGAPLWDPDCACEECARWR